MERAALSSDVQFARRYKWPFVMQLHDVFVLMYAIEPEAAFVHHFHSWKAFRPLVAALVVCATDGRSNASHRSISRLGHNISMVATSYSCKLSENNWCGGSNLLN